MVHHASFPSHGVVTYALPPMIDVTPVSPPSTDARAALAVGLDELSHAVPDVRFGQLVAAVGELCVDLHGRGLWDATDAELGDAVRQFRRDYESATTGHGRKGE